MAFEKKKLNLKVNFVKWIRPEAIEVPVYVSFILQLYDTFSENFLDRFLDR